MKRISFKVAKVIKDAGYPQIGNMNYASVDGATVMSDVTITIPVGELIDTNDYLGYVSSDFISAPTYLEVWLWLCKEKEIEIEVFNTNYGWYCLLNNDYQCDYGENPEEAIVAAIEYLVDNNLIK